MHGEIKKQQNLLNPKEGCRGENPLGNISPVQDVPPFDSVKNGWVKLNRNLFESKLWTDEKFTRGQAWVDLFGNANHKDNSFFVRGIEVKIKRGQIGWSEVTMSKRWRWSRNRVRRFLKWLADERQIAQQKTAETSITTILNYKKYQDTIHQTKQQTEQQTEHKQEVKEVKNKHSAVKPAQNPGKKYNPLGAEIIKAFETIDPKNKEYYGNKSQRGACDFLINEYGLDQVMRVIKILPKTNQITYIPGIYSAYDLKQKWSKLEDALLKEKNKKATKSTPNFII